MRTQNFNRPYLKTVVFLLIDLFSSPFRQFFRYLNNFFFKMTVQVSSIRKCTQLNFDKKCFVFDWTRMRHKYKINKAIAMMRRKSPPSENILYLCRILVQSNKKHFFIKITLNAFSNREHFYGHFEKKFKYLIN